MSDTGIRPTNFGRLNAFRWPKFVGRILVSDICRKLKILFCKQDQISESGLRIAQDSRFIFLKAISPEICRPHPQHKRKQTSRTEIAVQ